MLCWDNQDGMSFVRLRIPEPFVALVQAVLESYEGLALVRTHDKEGSVMVVVTTDDQRDDVASVLADLGRTMPWVSEEGKGESLEQLLGSAS